MLVIQNYAIIRLKHVMQRLLYKIHNNNINMYYLHNINDFLNLAGYSLVLFLSQKDLVLFLSFAEPWMEKPTYPISLLKNDNC